MRNFIRQLAAGTTLAMTVIAAPAFAAVDIAQAPTGFFVPTDAQKFDFPYYRGNGQDWSWTHGAIAAGFTTAKLTIAAFDVDSPDEVDEIYANDSGTWTLLGALTGSDSIWSYGNSFVLGASFFDDIATGLQVRIRPDATNDGWIVTLGKSVLTTDGSDLPPVLPGVPEPSSWMMMIAGFGFIGAMARRRKSVAVAA